MNYIYTIFGINCKALLYGTRQHKLPCGPAGAAQDPKAQGQLRFSVQSTPMEETNPYLWPYNPLYSKYRDRCNNNPHPEVLGWCDEIC